MLEIPPLDPHATVLEGLPVPLWPITLQRELGPVYRSLLRLEPGISSAPEAQVLVTIATGRKSSRALLRASLGESIYRSLDNLAKGNTATARIPEHLAGQKGIAPGELAEIARALFAKPPRDSLIVRLMLVVEGLLYRLAAGMLRYTIPCPCCEGNLLRTGAQWWGEQNVDIGAPEHALIDRILTDLVVLHLLSSQGVSILELAKPEAHPQANWLGALQTALRAKHLGDVPARAGAKKVNEHRVWAYARGENLPPEAVDDLLRQVNEPDGLRRSAVAVRALNLAADLVQACCRGPAVPIEQARALVDARLRELLQQMRLIKAHAEGTLRLVPRP